MNQPTIILPVSALDKLEQDMAEIRLQMVALIHNLEATKRERDKAYTILGWG